MHALPEGDVDALLDFADNALPGLRRANGWFCFDRELGGDLRGESPRYSVMVLLGMLRRAAAGRETSIDPAALHQQVHTQRDAFGVGDLGLLLWADSRIGSDRAELTMARLERLSSDQSALASLEGMEAAWFVLGAVHAVAAGLPAEPLVERSLAHLRTRRSRRSPLYRHYGDHRWRAVLPNFATQIYSLMALTEVARHELAPTAQAEAVGLANLLIHLRTDDAGWPWLFHADKATVVEPYEVYSVHQDAMAPMALLSLSEVTGDDRFARAAADGLRWCYGHNELSVQFYEPVSSFAHRSIRRRGWPNRANLTINTAFGLAFGARPRLDVGTVELNATCRPYHLGWILEAWSTRPAARALAAS